MVTGASSGIGAATARLLAAQDWRVIAVARRAERLEQLADGVVAVPVDLTDVDAPARVREAVEREGGRLELLVNNAGAEWRSTFAEGGYANVRQTMDVNFDAVVRLTEVLLPLLRRVDPELDGERQLRGGAHRTSGEQRLRRVEVRAGGLDRGDRRRGAAARRARGPGAAGVRVHRGLSPPAAARKRAHALARLDPREGRAARSWPLARAAATRCTCRGPTCSFRSCATCSRG